MEEQRKELHRAQSKTCCIFIPNLLQIKKATRSKMIAFLLFFVNRVHAGVNTRTEYARRFANTLYTIPVDHGKERLRDTELIWQHRKQNLSPRRDLS